MYRNERSVEVKYEGAVWTVTGAWEEGVPETLYEQGVGGGFSDYHIEFGKDVVEGDFNITEMLSPDHVASIVSISEEKIIEEE